MRCNKSLVVRVWASLCLAACTSNNGGSSCATNSTAATVSTIPSGSNVVPLTVNGSSCTLDSSNQYPNEPCISLTICEPGSSTHCQTIGNILLDTGSYGLRVFSSLTSSLNLPAVTQTTQPVATCVQFGDLSSEWGPVVQADLKLGGETASSVPIQLINQSFGTPSSGCDGTFTNPDTSPTSSRFNGILGVGLLAVDCSSSNCSGRYFTCDSATEGSTCTEISSPSDTIKVTHPVPLLSSNNNGIAITLPSVTDACGISSATGYMALGIGTQSNNTPGASVTSFPADTSAAEAASLYQAYSSSNLPAIIDSGSSTYFIPPPTGSKFPDCSTSHGDDFSGLYCPSSLSNQTANMLGTAGTPSVSITFNVSDAYNLIVSGNMVFSDIAASSGTGSNAIMDWGLPFFYGKTIYFGIIGKPTTTLGNGPFFAF